MTTEKLAFYIQFFCKTKSSKIRPFFGGLNPGAMMIEWGVHVQPTLIGSVSQTLLLLVASQAI